MSSAAIFNLLSPAALHSRCYARSPTLRDKGYKFTEKLGNGEHQGAGAKHAIVGVKWEKDSFVGTRGKRSVVAHAGMGRFSGAIHGGSKRKARKRRPRKEECDESVIGTEKHIESAVPDEETKSGDGTEVLNADGSSSEGAEDGTDDDEERGPDEEMEYKRYLQEIGVIQKVHEEGEVQGRSGAISGSSDATSDDPAIDLSTLLADKDQVQAVSISQKAAKDAPKEVDHEETKMSVSHPLDIDIPGETHDEGSKIYHELIIDRPEDVHVAEHLDIDRLGDICNGDAKMSFSEQVNNDGSGDLNDEGSSLSVIQEVGNGAAGEINYQVAGKQNGTLVSFKEIPSASTEDHAAPTLATEFSLSKNLGPTSEVSAVSSPVQTVGKNSRTGASVGFDSVGTEQIRVDDKVQKATNGFAQKRKKQAKKPSKTLIDNSSLNDKENYDNLSVRVVTGGAELPVIFSGLPECQSDGRPQDVLGTAGSVASLTSDGVLEPEIKVAEAEPELALMMESLNLELADTEGNDVQPVLKTGNAVKVPNLSKMDLDFRKDWTSGARLSDLYLQDSPVVALGSARSAVLSLSTTSDDDLSLSSIASAVFEQAVHVGSVVVDQMAEILPDVVTDSVGQVVEQVNDAAEQFANTVTEQVQHVADNVTSKASQVAENVTSKASKVAENVTTTAMEVAEQVTLGVENVANSTSHVVEQVSEFIATTTGGDDDDDDSDSDDEFESYKTSDDPEFRGKKGLENFTIKQEGQGLLSWIYDFYSYMLKQPLPEFAVAMFAAPVVVSAIFTLLYLPQFEGLAFDETARDFFRSAGGDAATLSLSWRTLFQVFMFSLSLSTGLQPELAPLSPYTLVIANLNALVAQLVFVFLSGAVFARLSQPSQPVRCSTVALVSATPSQRKRKELAIKVLSARYVLAGPQPCELVDVKVDLVYKYNTYTRTGSYFRATQPLKLVRPEIAFLTHGMLIRHVIDDRSPLYQRTPEMLKKEDAVFCLSVVGLERASMQPVFHVQHYCVVDNHVVWDADFEDLILINKKNKRVVDHSRLSMWRRQY